MDLGRTYTGKDFSADRVKIKSKNQHAQRRKINAEVTHLHITGGSTVAVERKQDKSTVTYFLIILLLFYTRFFVLLFP